MSFVVGSGSICQIGKEATWGTATTATALVNMTSESINTTINKGDEGNLLAHKVADTRDKLSVDVGGDISSVLRPEFAGLLIGAAMGEEDSTPVAGAVSGTYKHTFTLAEPGESLPSLTVNIDRGKVGGSSTVPASYVAQYPGMTVSSLSIDAAANDYVKCTASFVGKNSTTGSIVSSLKTFSEPSYKCLGASFTYGDSSTTVCASSVSIKLDNKLEEQPRTYCTGLYKGQPMPATREVTVSWEMPYNQKAKELEDAYYDCNSEANDATIEDLTLTFANGVKGTAGSTTVDKFPMTIKLAKVEVTSASHSIGGPGAVTASFEGIALIPASGEAMEVEVVDTTNSKWI